MAHIDYFLATSSPWCYLASDRLETIAERHNATIRYRPLDPLQLFERTGGVRPLLSHPSRVAYRQQELSRWATRFDMPLVTPSLQTVNVAPSSYAIIAAQETGSGDIGALVRGFLRARWVDDRDISDDDVIRSVLSNAGFDPSIADSGLFTGAEIYGRNLEQAVDAGVFGVPFYILTKTDERFWGQDRLEALDAALSDPA